MTHDQEEQLLRGLLMQALDRLSNLESVVGGLKQFHDAVAPRIEHASQAIIDLQSRRTTYNQVIWLSVIAISAVVGAFVGHLLDIYWKQ